VESTDRRIAFGHPYAYQTRVGHYQALFLFYLHIREPGGQVTSTPGVPEAAPQPALRWEDPDIQGESPSCASAGLSVECLRSSFRLELPSNGRGSLVNDTEAWTCGLRW